MNYYIADFETTSPNNPYFDSKKGVSIYLGGILDISTAFNKPNDIKIDYFHSMEEFLNVLKNIKQIDAIYFHNLAYDGWFIWRYLGNTLKFIPVNNLADLKTKNSMLMLKQKGMSILKMMINLDGRIIPIFCSYRKLGLSVGALGGSEYQKLDLDYDNVDYYNLKQEHYDYLKHDLVIPARAMLSIAKVENKYYWTQLTAGQTIFNKVKLSHNFMSLKYQNNYLFTSEEEYKLGKCFYHGGYTQFDINMWNIKYENINGIYADYKSCYPAKMYEKLPWKLITLEDIKNNHWEEEEDYIVGYRILIYKSKIKTGWRTLHDYVGYHEKINDIEEMYYFKKEWLWHLKFNDIKYEIIETYYYKIDHHYWLSNEVDRLIQQKIDLDIIMKEYDEDSKEYDYYLSHYNMVKVFINLLYGKLCQSPYFDNEFYFKEKYQVGDVINNTWIITVARSEKYKIGDYYAYLVNELNPKNPKYINIVLASYITSLSRINLFTNIWNNLGKVAYVDTDSCLSITNDVNMKFGSNIGDLELKYNKITDILITCAKGYEFWYLGKVKDKKKPDYGKIKSMRVIKKSGIITKYWTDFPKFGMYFHHGVNKITLKKANLKRCQTTTGLYLEYNDVDIYKSLCRDYDGINLCEVEDEKV